MKRLLLLGSFAALNFVAAPAAARADWQLEVGPGPDGVIVMYCDFCWFYNCDCNTPSLPI